MDRPSDDTASTVDGMPESRGCCAGNGYTYFWMSGFECPHDDDGETHGEGGSEGAAKGTAPDKETCSGFNSTCGGHCSGPRTLTGSIGTYLLGTGSIGVAYRTQASPTPASLTLLGCRSFLDWEGDVGYVQRVAGRDPRLLSVS